MIENQFRKDGEAENHFHVQTRKKYEIKSYKIYVLNN